MLTTLTLFFPSVLRTAARVIVPVIPIQPFVQVFYSSVIQTTVGSF